MADRVDELEAISEKIHEGWMATKRSQGIASRKSESGEELMVPYAELSETAKDLDRGSVKAVLDAQAALALPVEPPQLVEAIVREIEGEPFSTREELWDLVSKAVERIEMWTVEEVKEEFNGHVNYKGVIEISCASLADELNRIAVSLTPASRSQAKRIALQSGTPEIYKCLQIIEENAGKVADSDTSVENHASARLIESAVQRIRNAGASATPAPSEAEQSSFSVTAAQRAANPTREANDTTVPRLSEALEKLIEAGDDLRYSEYGKVEFYEGHIATTWDNAVKVLRAGTP